LRLGRIAYATADLGQALRLAEDAKRRFAEELGDRRGEAEAWMTAGAIYNMAGAGEQALDALAVALETFESVADRRGASLTRAHRALALYEVGRTAECDQELTEVSRAARNLQTRQPLLLAGLVSLRGMIDAGRNAEARDFGRQLFDNAVRSMPRFVVPIESMMGLAIARAGDAERGVRHAEAAMARLESQKATEDEDPQRIYAHLALVLDLAGRHDQARGIWTQAATTLAEIEVRLPEALAGGFRERAINKLIARAAGTP
jgi:tetratricopeptide (TPR) repeat protein